MIYLNFLWTLARGFAVTYVMLAGLIVIVIGLICFALWTAPSVTLLVQVLPLAARILAVVTGIITLVWIFDKNGGRSEW